MDVAIDVFNNFFNHSDETIHRLFHLFLAFVLKMSVNIIKPAEKYNDDVPKYIKASVP